MEQTSVSTIENKDSVFSLPMVALRGKVLFPDVLANVDIGRKQSLNAIDFASTNETDVFFAAQRDAQIDDPKQDDVYNVGVVCKIRQIIKIPGNNARINLKCMYRARIVAYLENDNFFEVSLERFENNDEEPSLVEAYFRVAKDISREYLTAKQDKDSLTIVDTEDDPDVFINVMSSRLSFKETDKQALLESASVIDKLKRFEELVSYESEVSKIEKRISTLVRQNIDKSQKEYFLREQLKAIHTELGDDEDEKELLRTQILDKHMPQETEDKAIKELNKLDKINPTSPEYTVIRNYLDWLIDLPFSEQTEDNPDLRRARKVLDEDHFGLEKVKERIVEYLAVLSRTKKLHGPILCFVGPPGVGKTSVAKSIARALDRKFVRMSLGGVKDEAEIRGHRRTYIGAMPGRIIYALKNAGSINPVFLLDEIDKLSSDLRGDPASALLEVLDPEQNSTFRDRYLEVPYDLSKVLFITTANTLDTIPAPLFDRMEVIELSGYTEEEKTEIAKQYLIPKKREENGLEKGNIEFREDAIKLVISGYTMEAGVRTLERELGSIARKVAVKLTEQPDLKKQIITAKSVEGYLGARKYQPDESREADEVGAATGLAWTAFGGATLVIEARLMKGKGELILTGKLGDVMKESARAAISYLRANAQEYGIDADTFDTHDLHVHVPEGATPKDGPSAGITMATAILSELINKPISAKIAMTGEITLRGKVLPIGGLKEKSLAAYRMGIRKIIIPEANVKDLEQVPEKIRGEIEYIPVKMVDEVFKAVELK